MADTKISAMTAAAALDGTEAIPVVQGGANEQATAFQFGQYGSAPMFCYINSAYTLTSTTASQQIFNTTTNGALTLPQTGLYIFSGRIYVTGMSATSGNGAFSILGAGTATLTNYIMNSIGVDSSTTGNANTQSGNWAVSSAFTTNTVTASTGTSLAFEVGGVFKCTATGTIIPSLSQVTAAASVVAAGSYIVIQNIADNAVYTRGAWS